MHLPIYIYNSVEFSIWHAPNAKFAVWRTWSAWRSSSYQQCTRRRCIHAVCVCALCKVLLQFLFYSVRWLPPHTKSLRKRCETILAPFEHRSQTANRRKCSSVAFDVRARARAHRQIENNIIKLRNWVRFEYVLFKTACALGMCIAILDCQSDVRFCIRIGNHLIMTAERKIDSSGGWYT